MKTRGKGLGPKEVRKNTSNTPSMKDVRYGRPVPKPKAPGSKKK